MKVFNVYSANRSISISCFDFIFASYFKEIDRMEAQYVVEAFVKLEQLFKIYEIRKMEKHGSRPRNNN